MRTALMGASVAGKSAGVKLMTFSSYPILPPFAPLLALAPAHIKEKPFFAKLCPVVPLLVIMKLISLIYESRST